MLLDTNVVSELMRPSPETAVQPWMSRQPPRNLFFSAIGEAELRYGAAIRPAGRRRATLVFEIEAMLRDAFEDRILAFDRAAARAYGRIAAGRRSTGRSSPLADCQIAGIEVAHGLTVATRNIRDFEDMGFLVVNPWTAA